MFALGALSAELIFGHAILKEIGLSSFLIHARANSSTALTFATKQGASRKMKHIHTRFWFIKIWYFRNFKDVISQGTIPKIEIDVWHGNRAEGDEFTWQMVQWRRVTVEIWIRV